MIDKKNYDVFQIKYKWDIEFVISDTGKSFRPHNLKRVEKLNDYENNFFPIFKLFIQIQDKFFDLIFKTQRRLICKIKLIKKYYSDLDDDATDEGESKSFKEELILQDSFVAFFDKIPADYTPSDTLVTEENIDKVQEVFNKDEDSISGIVTTDVSVTLWHINSLKSYKTIINRCFESASVGSGLAYIINNTDLIQKAIVDLPDNQLEYHELVLLPYGLRNSLKSLQLRYGVYFNGMWVFLDNGTLYCLKAFSINHQHEKDKAGYTIVNLYQKANSIHIPYLVGVQKQDKSYCLEADGKLKKQNMDVMLGEIFGDATVYSNFETILNTIEGNGPNVKTKSPTRVLNREKTSHKDSGVRLDLEYDELNNPYNLTALMRKNTMNMVVPITVKGVDMEAFTPEKIVQLNIDDQAKTLEYGGSYCIRNAVFEFIPNRDVKNRFETTCIGSIALSRVPDDIISG